jgi:hypothetical protein
MALYSKKPKPKAKKKQSLAPLWLGLTGLGLLFIAFWAFFGNNAQVKGNIEVKGSPSLKVDNDTIDRGNIKLGTPIRDEIRLTNVGDQPLRFVEAPYIEVREGC